MTVVALTAAVALGSAACGDNDSGTGDGPYDLSFHGHGYTPHDMQTLRVAIVDVAADQTIATDEVVVSDGSFAFHWPSLLEKDKSYRIDFYADLSGDGECNDPPEDHAWSVSIQSVTADQDVQQDHVLDFSHTACDSFSVAQTFNLTFNGVSFDPHNGDDLYVAVVRSDDSQVLATDMITLSGGQFSFSWTDILEEGKAYHIDFYADTDASGTCGGADHIWRESIPTVADDVSVIYTHGIVFEPLACESF